MPIVLLACTVLTTLYCGYALHVSFVVESLEEYASFRLQDDPALLLQGFPFALALLAILLAHEMGHYLACRYYGIRATLPFVIPAPPILPIPPPLSWILGASFPFGWALLPFNPFGTFGAVIRIKSMFANRRQLFDVGIAGPLAGFVVILPALVVGVLLSKDFVMLDSEGFSLWFGEPLLFQLASTYLYGGDTSNITLHPIGMAAWFGMLATSLNLLPIGQLDGGHIVYALFGPKIHRRVSMGAFGGLIGLSLYAGESFAYLIFALLLILMGFRHPRPYQEQDNINNGRWLIAALGLVIFVLTFMPVPIRLIEHSVTL